MAIDLRVTDSVDITIVGKLNGIARSANAAADAIDRLNRTNVKAKSVSFTEALGGSSTRQSSSSQSRTSTRPRVESAAVTAVKDLNKQRQAITAVFEKGFREREAVARKVEALEAKELASQQKNAAAASRIAKQRIQDTIAQNTGITSGRSMTASARKQMQSQFDDLFGAHTLTTTGAAKNFRKVIDDTIVTGSKPSIGASRTASQNFYNGLFGATPDINLVTRPAKQNIQRIINETVGVAKESTATAKRQMQSYYNDAFGAHNISTVAPKQNTQSVVAQTTGIIKPSSNASLNRQQKSYDNLFGAVPTGAREAAKGVDALSASMSKLDSSVSFLRSDGLRWAKVFAALGGITLTAGAVVGAADAYTRLQNRLSIASQSQAQLNQLTEDMLRISTASRQPIEATAQTFSRIDLAMKQLGRSQSDSMKITENVSKALKIGGATAGEAASALLQLSQAFNKGKLDGDEFRSVMENSPILADALAKKLKVTRGELLALAPKGKITAEIMAQAFIGATDEINAAFAKLRPTIEEAFTVFRNYAVVFFGELDKSVGVTNAVAQAVMALGKHLDTITFAFLSIMPLLTYFVGTKVLAGLVTFGRYLLGVSAAIGAVRNPLFIAAAGMVSFGRTAVTSALTATSSFGRMAASAVSNAAIIATAMTTAAGRTLAASMVMEGAAVAMSVVGVAASRAGKLIMSAFSFGNVFLVITTAIAALIAFGDQWEVAGMKGVTFRDMTIAVFQEVGAFIADVFNTIYDAVTVAFGGMVDQSETTASKVGTAMQNTALAAAVTIDACTTLGSNLLGFLQQVVLFFSDTIRNVFTLLQNFILGAVNVAIDALNGIGSAANSVLEAIGSDMRFGNIAKFAGKEFSSQFIDGFQSDLFGNKHGMADTLVDSIIPNVKARAQKIADGRKTDSNLRGVGKAPPPLPDKKKKGKTDEEKRADILKKVELNEQAATKAALQYGDAKEITAKVEETNNKLIEKGFRVLTPLEREHIANLVQTRLEAERVGKAQEAIYNTSGAKYFQDYAASIAAANNMLRSGAITQERYAAIMQNAKNVYTDATDASYKYAKALSDAKELQGHFGADGAAAKAMQEATQNAIANNKAAPVGDEATRIQDSAKELYYLQKAVSAANSEWNTYNGALEDNVAAIDAVTNKYKEGGLSLDTYTQRMAALMSTQMQLDQQMNGITDPFDPMRQGLYQLVAEMPTLSQSMADAIQSTLGNAIDNVSSSIATLITDFDSMSQQAEQSLGRPVSTLETVQFALANIIKQVGQEMIAALIKMGIQWAIQATMGDALAASSNAIAVAQAVSTGTAINAAMTPAAVSASIATMGGAAAVGTTAFMAAQAAGRATSAIPAFADGSGVIKGSGNGRSDSMLAWLSNGEMVMNAGAVQANYGALTAMQNGAVLGGGGGQDNSVHVTVIVNSDGTTSEQGQYNDLAKNIVGYVKLEVQSQLGKATRQGQPLYR